MSATEDLRLYYRLLRHVWPYKWVFCAAVGGMLLVAAGDASLAAMVQPIIDRGFVDRDQAFIQWLPLALIALGVTRALGNFIDGYCMSWVARRVIADLREKMFARLLRAPAQFYDQHASGALTARLTYNVEQVAGASTGAIRTLFRDGAKALFLLCLMFYLSWKLSLSFAVIIPIAYLIFKFSSRKFRAISLRIQQSVGDITHIVKEALTGHRLVKIFGAYKHQQRLFYDAVNRNRQQSMKAAAVESLSVPLIVLLSSLGMAVVVWLALQQQTSPGVFAAYLTAMIMSTKPLRSLSRVNLVIQGGLAGAQSVFETIDLPQEPDRGAIQLRDVRGEVQFDNVSFHYLENGPTVLERISMHIRAGQTVALVGASGSGKSTIASLLLRFYSPSAGVIRLDGTPLEDLTLESLRANTAIVTQEVTLFDDTIAANIVYGARIDQQKLRAAAMAAACAEFVDAMPDGFASRVGEQGVRLSGGQRQRIAIARALYKDAPLLIMDEATSSLDSTSERRIQSAITQLIKNRTSLIIAHRLSTIENADLILVLERGQIVERGAHHELLQANGAYARLYNAQHGAPLD